MEKISRIAFKKKLITHQSLIVGRLRSINLDFIEDYINNCTIPPHSSEYRTVTKVQTNALQFSNGSWLYFDAEAKSKSYHQYKDFILLYEEYDYDILPFCLIYHIKEKK